MLVNLLDHGVIRSLNLSTLDLIGVAGLALKIDPRFGEHILVC